MSLPNPDGVQILLTLGSLAVAWVSLRKVIVPAWKWCRQVSTRVGAALDTLGGRPPIVDRVTGKEVAPEQPPLGIVLADMKAELARVGDQSARLDRIESRVDTVESAVSGMLAEKYDNGTQAVLAAVEKRNADTIDAEDVTP